MKTVAGEQGLALQQLFPHKSSQCFKNSNHHKISFFNARGLKLGHCDFFQQALSILALNFIKSRSRDGLTTKGLYLRSVLVCVHCIFNTLFINS